MNKIGLLAIVVSFSLHTSRAQVVNGSLEDTSGTFVSNGDNYMELAAGSTALPGWTVISNSVSWLPNGNPWDLTTPFDSMFLDLTGNRDDGSLGGIAQILATLPGMTYRLSLSLGSQQDQPGFSGPMSVLVTAGAASRSFTFNPSGAGNQWGDFSFDFVASPSVTLITIVGTGSGGGSYLGLDHIQVGAPVPEASSFSLLAAGTIVFIALGWKGNKPGSRGLISRRF